MNTNHVLQEVPMSDSSGDIPTAMKAAVIDQFGAPEVMHLATIPIPRSAPTTC